SSWYAPRTRLSRGAGDLHACRFALVRRLQTLTAPVSSGKPRHARINAESAPVYRLSLVSLLLLHPAFSASAGEFQFKDGDRVALVGSTLIEREQKYGYWELALTTRHPNKTINFRNLGWSGDTVWGESRVGFDLDNPQKGFERLRDGVLAVKPTVIIVGYGTNESFAGEAGLPRVQKRVDKKLGAVAPTQARVGMLAPPALL